MRDFCMERSGSEPELRYQLKWSCNREATPAVYLEAPPNGGFYDPTSNYYSARRRPDRMRQPASRAQGRRRGRHHAMGRTGAGALRSGPDRARLELQGLLQVVRALTPIYMVAPMVQGAN